MGIRRSWLFGFRAKFVSHYPFHEAQAAFEEGIDRILAHLPPEDRSALHVEASTQTSKESKYHVRAYVWGHRYRTLGPKFNIKLTFKPRDECTTQVWATVIYTPLVSLALFFCSVAVFWSLVLIVAGFLDDATAFACFWLAWALVFTLSLARIFQTNLVRVIKNIKAEVQ